MMDSTMTPTDFFTADICDAHPHDVRVLVPLFHPYGGAVRCRGPVATLRIDEDNGEIIAMLKEPGDSQILVVDAQEAYCAVVGENLMKLALANGWAAIVINGYVRDIHVTETIGVGLWALGTCPRKSPKKSAALRNVGLEFGGVAIEPGDYCYADRDGIILMPENVLES